MMPKRMRSGIPIFAASSIPFARPRERIQTFSASVRAKKKVASGGSDVIEPACWPR